MWAARGAFTRNWKEFAKGAKGAFRQWNTQKPTRVYTQPTQTIIIAALPASTLRSITSLTSRRKIVATIKRTFFSVGYLPNAEKKVLYSIIGANVAVFLLWNTYGNTKEGRHFMYKNFTASVTNLLSGRIHAIVTSCFSQMDFLHLLFNMMALSVFGPEIIVALGTRRFLGLYFFAGIGSGLAHIFYLIHRSNYDLHQASWNDRFALGASGSINALSVYYAIGNPFRIIYVYFFPVYVSIFVGGMLAYDLYMTQSSRSRTAHSGHIGGAAVGAAYYFWHNRARFLRR